MTNAIPIDAVLAYDDLYPDGRMGLDNDEFIGFGDIPVDFLDYVQVSQDIKEVTPANSFKADIIENIVEEEEIRSIDNGSKNKNSFNVPEEFDYYDGKIDIPSEIGMYFEAFKYEYF